MNVVRFWYHNARPTALPQSMLPAVLAAFMAVGAPGFSWWLALLAVVGVALGHLGLNLFDDYFDFRRKGADYRNKMAGEGIRARIAKCSYLTSGEATVNQLLLACVMFSLLAVVLGVIIWAVRGEFILWMALITAVLGISYSGAPLRLSYHGFGELEIGVIFGPLVMAGVYYSAAGTISPGVLFVSVPVGLLVANIVYTHSIMDYEPDRKAGKMTLAVLLTSKTAMLVALGLLLFGAFAIVIAGVILGFLHVAYLFLLLLLPMAGGLFHMMVWFTRDPQREFQPRPWMGPMGNWEGIKAIGIDWFMIRWLVARNLLSFFCLFTIILSLIYTI